MVESSINLLYKIKIEEKGKIINEFESIARSFVKNFLNMWFAEFNRQNGLTTVVDMSGSSWGSQRAGTYGYDWMGLNASSGVDTYGIVVGSGSTPVTADDYNLASKIQHGTGAGQLSYGSCAVDVPVVSGNNIDLTISRTFTNGSGADVTINEIGLVARWYNGAYRSIMIARDVLNTPVTVANGQNATVQYIIRTTI